MKKSVKAIVICSLAAVLGFSMSFAPVLAGSAHAASSAEDMTYEELEGENVEELKGNSDTSAIAEDPELYRYYDVDDEGDLHEKDVELDEVDEFIRKMDENAEGISDTEIDEMSGEMNAVGCGVSGLGKAQTPSKYKKYKRYHCLDISWWQGNISADSWKKVKAAGVTHVILRSSYTSLGRFSLNLDSRFGNNLKRAHDAGIKVGVYHFSQATSVSEAEKEAAYVVKVLSSDKSKIKLPVVFDYETNASGRLNMSKLRKLAASGTSTRICQAFCNKVKAAGYTPMVYANYTTLTNYLDYKTLQKQYRIWLANYTTKGTATTYPGEYWMWQYSSSGKVNGLSGSIDMNYIWDNGQGGSSTSAPSTTATTTGSTTTTAGSSPSVAACDPYKVITTTDLNYRTGPGTGYTLKGQYAKGKVLTVVGRAGKWRKLSTGYCVNSKYLDRVYDTKSVSSYKVKTTKKLNYRTGPGTSFTLKGQYAKGKVLTVVGKAGKWRKLSTGYYVNSKYLDRVKTAGYKAKTTTSVNYRTGPGASYKKAGTYSKGKVIRIVSKKNGWGKMSNGYYIYLYYTKKL